jgi:hypothetical protein
MTPEEKAAAKAPLLEKRKAIEAKIAALKQKIRDIESMPSRQDTQGSEVGSPEAIDDTVELQAELEDAEQELTANATEANKYAGRRRRRRGGADRLRELEAKLDSMYEDLKSKQPGLEKKIMEEIKEYIDGMPVAPEGVPVPVGSISQYTKNFMDNFERKKNDRAYDARSDAIGLINNLRRLFDEWKRLPGQGGRRKTARRHRKARKTRRS